MFDKGKWIEESTPKCIFTWNSEGCFINDRYIPCVNKVVAVQSKGLTEIVLHIAVDQITAEFEDPKVIVVPDITQQPEQPERQLSLRERFRAWVEEQVERAGY